MDPRYIFTVQCHNTQTWWLRPPTSSFRRVDFLHILFEVLVLTLLVLFLNLIWEGTCTGFFVDLFLQCQVPRTTPCLLSHLSHPFSRHLIYAHEFIFLSKITSVFEYFEWSIFWLPGQNIRPPGRNIRGAGLSG
jgi:hypothetical protein